jgi:secreted Zn-dependent insulinase-like peptidase
LKLAEGIAHLLQTSIIEQNREKFKEYTHRKGAYHEETTLFWMRGRNKDLIKGTRDFWSSIADFEQITSEEYLINKIDLEFKKSLEDDRKRRRHAIKYLAVDIKHPYSRLGVGDKKTLTTPNNLKEQVGKFYKAAYARHNMAIVIVTNQDKHGFGMDQQLYEDVKNNIQTHSGNLPSYQNYKLNNGNSKSKIGPKKKTDNGKTNSMNADEHIGYGVPFKNLPQLICLNSKVYDMMLLRFQIKTDLKSEIRHESVKFVSYMLEFMLRDTFHNTELPLVHNVTVTPKYFHEYSFIDVEMHYSLEGKSRTDKIIATVMKTKEILEKHIDLKLYADMAQEIRSIFNTKPMERGTRVARKIARGILKFGYTHAYSATQVLNNYEKNYVNMVLDNIDYSSLLIVI